MTITETRAPAPAAAPPSGHSDRTQHERRLGLMLSSPAFVVMVLVTAYPLIYAVVLSLYKYRLTDPDGREFVGLGNYVTVLTDPVWWNNVGHHGRHHGGQRGGGVGAGLLLRLGDVPHPPGPVAGAHRHPHPLRDHHRGLRLHLALRLSARLGLRQPVVRARRIQLVRGRWSSLFVITLSEIWKTTPFISLLLLAGLVQVPGELQEAATVDGATAWQRLWKVTLPNMKAAIMVALLFRTLDAWRIFDNPFIMTQGANNTETLSFLAYRQNVTLVNLGAGSAVSVLLFLTVALIAFVFIKGFKTNLSQVKGES